MTVADRLATKISPEPNSGCWLWTGCVDENGYGRFLLDGKNRRAHRVAYSCFKAPVPAGLTLDHLCRVRSCVNPDHMEPVTLAENIRRGDQGPKGWKRHNTHCPHGHALVPANVGWHRVRGKLNRQCLTCRRAQRRAHRRRSN